MLTLIALIVSIGVNAAFALTLWRHIEKHRSDDYHEEIAWTDVHNCMSTLVNITNKLSDRIKTIEHRQFTLNTYLKSQPRND